MAFFITRTSIVSEGGGGGGSTDFGSIFRYTDFSSGTLGNNVSVSGFEFFASSLTYADDFVDTGFTKSAKAVINQASGAMGWNATLFTANSLRRYDELWHSFRIRPAVGSNFNANPFFKFFRAHNSAANDDSGGNNRGHSDIYLNNSGYFHYITESISDEAHPLAGSSTAYAPTAGEWPLVGRSQTSAFCNHVSGRRRPCARSDLRGTRYQMAMTKYPATAMTGRKSPAQIITT